MALTIRDPGTGLKRGPIVWRDGCIRPAYGCRWCGFDVIDHGWKWKPSIGFHQWVEPTTAQIKARMRARRNIQNKEN